MKMVTYFNRTDLVNFGLYLLSDERRERIRAAHIERIKDFEDDQPTLEESLQAVHHADVENWLQKMQKDKSL